MPFRILIDKEAKADIQEGIDWYNDQKAGLGIQFLAKVSSTVNRLKSSPYFQVRYDDVRCLPIKQFPFMIHFTIDEGRGIVVIRAAFHTSRSTENWNKRKNKPT